MNPKSKGYMLIVVLLCAFALTIYGAYSPARKAQKQQIVCVKFKKGVENAAVEQHIKIKRPAPKRPVFVENAAVEQHMNGFAALKHEIPQVVGYTSGKTILPNQAVAEYDVMHYLTFQSEADIKIFETSAAYKQFVSQNEGVWDKTLVVNADIR